MINRRKFCVCLSAALLTNRQPVLAASSNRTMVALANNIFANLFQGRPTGAIIETIDLVLRRMGREPSYIVLPPTEIPGAIADGTVDINSVTVQTDANSGSYRFSAPIITEYNVVAINAEQSLKVEKVSDLYGLKLGGRSGYQYPLLDTDPRINLIRFAQDGELIRNLIHKRVDAAIVSAVSDVYKLRAEGVMTRIKVLSHAVGTVPLRAAFSSQRFGPEDLAQFDELLGKLKASDDWMKILARNGLADLAVEWPVISR